MSGVFRNIDPYPVEELYCKRPIQCLTSSEILTPPHRSASVYPPPLVRGEDTLAGWREGGGSIFWKTPDTALYSIYVCTLCDLTSDSRLLSGAPSPR